MTSSLIREDRGRGPEIVGTRITVYNLLPYFLDATSTEADICQMYQLTAEQVSAARAYILNHPDTVLAEHLKIEARMAKENPPEVIEGAKRMHAAFLSFRQWLLERERPNHHDSSDPPASAGGLPAFNQWRAQQESRLAQGS